MATSPSPERLLTLAREAVKTRKHHHLSPDDYDDAVAACVEEGIVQCKVQEARGFEGVLTLAMRRAYGRWEYRHRKLARHESPESFDNPELYDDLVYDLYFAEEPEAAHRSEVA